MKASVSRVGLLTVFVGLGLLGCEQWRGQAIRRNGADASSQAPADKANEMDSLVPPGQHSSSLRPGGLSSLAREIESHFNSQ